MPRYAAAFSATLSLALMVGCGKDPEMVKEIASLRSEQSNLLAQNEALKKSVAELEKKVEEQKKSNEELDRLNKQHLSEMAKEHAERLKKQAQEMTEEKNRLQLALNELTQKKLDDKAAEADRTRGKEAGTSAAKTDLASGKFNALYDKSQTAEKGSARKAVADRALEEYPKQSDKFRESYVDEYCNEFLKWVMAELDAGAKVGKKMGAMVDFSTAQDMRSMPDQIINQFLGTYWQAGSNLHGYDPGKASSPFKAGWIRGFKRETRLE